jgi:hypothetical protein
MTTKNVLTFVYIAVLGFSLATLFASFALAQDNTPVTDLSVDSVLLSEATSTEAVQITPAISEPWFKIEELFGEVNQGDFVVGPGRAELEVKPGQTVVYEMSVANRISDDRTFRLEVEDVAGSNDASQAVVFLGEQRGPYTIRDYISFPENTFNLDLGERARIPVTISIPADAEPGGYYGGVLVSTIRDTGADADGITTRSPIIARIGTLFFITVPGEIVKSGETKDFALTDKSLWYEKGPIKLSILYENTGTTHLNPYGEMRVHNLFGEEVGFLELEPWFVLPKSLRSRDIVWDRELLLGRYTATVNINRGYDDIVDEFSVVFWVMPWKIVLGVFVVLFILIFIFRFFFRNFEFKRR